MDWLPKNAHCLHLQHNEHKNFYEKVEDFYEIENFVSKNEWEKAIKEDSVWELIWYPDTPISFYRISASSLEAIQKAVEELE